MYLYLEYPNCSISIKICYFFISRIHKDLQCRYVLETSCPDYLEKSNPKVTRKFLAGMLLLLPHKVFSFSHSSEDENCKNVKVYLSDFNSVARQLTSYSKGCVFTHSDSRFFGLFLWSTLCKFWDGSLNKVNFESL